jgi:formylglycine-generating enzyme required for sulfatase activity
MRKINRVITIGAAGKFLLIMNLCPVAIASDGADVNKSFEQLRDCDICSEIIILPPGKYMMGATEEEFKGHDKYKYIYKMESPRHEVYVKSFGIARFDVTRQQFEVFAKETGFDGKGCKIFNGKTWVFDTDANWKNPGFKQTGQDPVVCVSWNDAQEFIAWLNLKITNKNTQNYRLPTEAEWEYAARAGTVTPTYWGNDSLNQCKFANTRDLSAKDLDPETPYVNCEDGYVETSPVGAFQPNAWGLFDMLGNVNQWVLDCWYFDYSASTSAAMDTARKALGTGCDERRARGAGWSAIPINVRAASRSGFIFNTRISYLGFRLAVDLQ